MSFVNGSISSLALSYLNVAQITQFKQSEDTVKQGGNYFLSLLPAIGQISLFFADLGTTIPSLTSNTTLAYRATTITDFALTALAITSYLAKGQFIGTDKDSVLKREWVASILDFTARRGTDIVQVALVVVNVAKFTIGMPGEAALGLLAVTVGYADKNGYLPTKVSAFYNKQFTVITSAILLLIGSPFQKVVAFTNLFFKIAPIVLSKAFYELDKVCEKFWASHGLPYPKLKEVTNLNNETPTLRKCSFETLEKLSISSDSFVIDPSHAKWTPSLQIDMSQLTENTHMDLWSTLDFEDEETYSVLEVKLLGDQRFANDIIPTIKDAEVKTIAEILSKKRKTTFGVVESEQAAIQEANAKIDQDQKECRADLQNDPAKLAKWKQYVVDISKEQYVTFFKNINGEKKAVGNTFEGFEEAQKKSKQILAVLAKMDAELNGGTYKGDVAEARQLIRTVLLNFAIDGGDYCVQGIKRVNQENMELILTTSVSTETPIMDQLSLKLKSDRLNLFRASVTAVLNKRVKEATKEKQDFQTFTFDTFAEGFERRLGTLPEFIKGKDSYGRWALSATGNFLVSIPQKLAKMNQEASHDTHTMNEFILTYGQGLGLPVEEARQDTTLEVSKLTEFMFPVLLPAARAIVWYNAYPYEEAEDDKTVLDRISALGTRIHGMIPTAVLEGAAKLKNEAAQYVPQAVIQVKNKVQDVKKEIFETKLPGIAANVRAFASQMNILSVDSYVDTFIELVRVNEMSQQVTDWWVSYIANNPDLTAEQKEKLNDLIEDYSGEGLFVYDVDTGRTNLNRDWALKMLQINGFIRVKPQPKAV